MVLITITTNNKVDSSLFQLAPIVTVYHRLPVATAIAYETYAFLTISINIPAVLQINCRCNADAMQMECRWN